MNQLYPLKFETIFKDKIWGGQKIRTVLGKDFGDLPNCGETWEISGVKDNESIVANGPLKGLSLPKLINEFKGELVGEKVYTQFGAEFPLLIKFLDANADLSIQVHPDDDRAKAKHDSMGKTEMWYVFQADKGASLISGFNQPVTKESYLKAVESGTLMSLLNREQATEGDVFFLPAGRVHTIGKGLCITEIQQTSDITYRIYDFDRVDANGNKRELHVEQAAEAIDYNFYPEYKTCYKDKINETTPLVSCSYFETNKLTCTATITRNYTHDSFTILICFEGELTLKYESGEMNIKKGEAILIPASIKTVQLIPSPEFKALETFVPSN